MKTKLLRKIRKLCLIKYVSNNYKDKELVLFNKKNNTIKKNRIDAFMVSDLAFVLRELNQTELLSKYNNKRAYKTFKRL
jgi:hypothetical protein